MKLNYYKKELNKFRDAVDLSRHIVTTFQARVFSSFNLVKKNQDFKNFKNSKGSRNFRWMNIQDRDQTVLVSPNILIANASNK